MCGRETDRRWCGGRESARAREFVRNGVGSKVSFKWPCLSLRKARHDAGKGAGEGWRVVVVEEEDAWPAEEGEVG